MARSIWAGAGATLISEAIGRGAAMGFQMLVANQLGADRFGIVALALASAAILSPLADAGLPNLALRLVSESPADNSLVHCLGGLKVLLTPLFLVPLVIWSALRSGGMEGSMALLWAGAFYGFQASSDLLRQILRARQEVGRELSARFAYPVGNILALLAVWRFHPGPAGALLALASGPAALTIAYLVAMPKGSRLPKIEGATWALAGRRYPFLLQSVGYLLVVGLATRIDAFLLEKYAGRAEVGRYFAALNLVMAGGFFAQGLSSYLYPRLHRQREHRGRALLRAAGIQGALGVGLAAGAAFLGPVLFETVFRAKSFHGAETLLPGLGVLLFLTTLDWLWLSVLIGRNRIWMAALNLVPLLTVKLVLGPVWVSRWGAQGMVWTALAGQIGTGLLGVVAAYRQFTLDDAKGS
jgi:O-antigen/teichoic acid export membrane protein